MMEHFIKKFSIRHCFTFTLIENTLVNVCKRLENRHVNSYLISSLSNFWQDLQMWYMQSRQPRVNPEGHITFWVRKEHVPACCWRDLCTNLTTNRANITGGQVQTWNDLMQTAFTKICTDGWSSKVTADRTNNKHVNLSYFCLPREWISANYLNNSMSISRNHLKSEQIFTSPK